MNRNNPANSSAGCTPATPAAIAECEVVVVGGGPVGLLAANLLGLAGIHTLVFEKRAQPPQESMAIGITPPSLEILKPLGLDIVFEREGLPVVNAGVFEAQTPLGRLDFSGIDSDYRYFLSLPQSKTIEILSRNLSRFPSVTCFRGAEFLGFEQSGQSIHARMKELDLGLEYRVSAQFLVGADGHRSRVREQAGLTTREKTYPQKFVMADFDDSSSLGKEARLFFNAEASVESFPLPGGKRRWIVLANQRGETPPLDYLVAQVRRLTGLELAHANADYVSGFGARRMEVSRYYSGRTALCGDAAHVMSSIGGQGMNTGFADAEMLVAILVQALKYQAPAEPMLREYDRIRRKAFRVAAARAARGMWLGTRRGRLASRLRKHFIRDFLFSPWMAGKLAPYFSMLTVPGNNLSHARAAWHATFLSSLNSAVPTN